MRLNYRKMVSVRRLWNVILTLCVKPFPTIYAHCWVHYIAKPPCTQGSDTMVSYTLHPKRTGNSLIQFYPQGNRSTLVSGSIKYIYQDQDRFVLAVQRQFPASNIVSDPYTIYPDFPAKLYSSQLSAELERVQTDWIYSHCARWNLSDTQSVVLSLSRVSHLVSICILI